ncbi:MAG: hypothetical protein mread185_000321 [Mycoplasmataceae bacterium]|nr:MAG: hypothetical protein mread185_000321 [Mycoplasmataceae bacterium]
MEVNNSEKEDWKAIHPDFEKSEFNWTSTPKLWKELGLTYQDAREWIKVGFKPKDYNNIESWKNLGFTSKKAREWISAGLLIHEYRLANELEQRKITPRHLAKQLKGRRDAQGWLDVFYPKEERESTVHRLNISQENLTGSLKISDFPNLTILNCSLNQITKLTITNCPKLETLYCHSNQLSDLNFLMNLNKESLVNLHVNDNKINVDLSKLNGFNQLKHLDVLNTNVISIKNLENLPKSLETIVCNGLLAQKLKSYNIPKGYYDRDWYSYKLLRKDKEKLNIIIDRINNNSSKTLVFQFGNSVGEKASNFLNNDNENNLGLVQYNKKEENESLEKVREIIKKTSSPNGTKIGLIRIVVHGEDIYDEKRRKFTPEDLAKTVKEKIFSKEWQELRFEEWLVVDLVACGVEDKKKIWGFGKDLLRSFEEKKLNLVWAINLETGLTQVVSSGRIQYADLSKKSDIKWDYKRKERYKRMTIWKGNDYFLYENSDSSDFREPLMKISMDKELAKELEREKGKLMESNKKLRKQIKNQESKLKKLKEDLIKKFKQYDIKKDRKIEEELEELLLGRQKNNNPEERKNFFQKLGIIEEFNKDQLEDFFKNQEEIIKLKEELKQIPI